MKTIAQMLKPRKSVFLNTTREDVLNLSDFAEKKVDASKFFNENFNTQGMKMLFDTAFNRFKGESDTGVIKLTQAMGGGKTHSMLALALLASNKIVRKKILDEKFHDIGDIKVLTFSGRENAEFGIWGSLAEQLGKKEMFKSYYSPLRAPGESAWVNLLKDDKILILFDELPPYLENARSITVGNSDLSKVTVTALANLFSALGKAQLANVCLVFSDLQAAYESGSDLLQSSFKELEKEASRIALDIAPVASNSDEVYAILKKRLFEDEEISTDFLMEKNNIAIAFKDEVSKTKTAGFSNYTGEAVYKGISDSYPFHPSIRDLYARFKENQNFQQTRGLIKLMRQVVRQFFESGQAEKSYLINVFDVNLNNANMMALFRQIKPSLEEAVSHDIAQDKQSIAESIDADRPEKKEYAQQLAKLMLVSSLSTANHAVLGLTEQDILGYMSAPGNDINAIKSCLEELKNQCWYIKEDNRGRIYYQNTKNMIAEMNTLVDSYTIENAKKELREILKDNFEPKIKSCYSKLYVLPAPDEIDIDAKQVSLIIFEPYAGNQMHPQLQAFYDQLTLKNRVMFLSGNRSIMDKLYENSKKLKAIQTIMATIKDERISARDQQYIEAERQVDKAAQALFSTIRETFITLYYPMKNGIQSADFKLEFKANKFDGEKQIINVLTDNMKFNDFSKEDNFLETLRKKCEMRIFTTKEMTFSQILDRAATETSWQWYHPGQMESLMDDAIKKDKWREIGGYLKKGPFEKEPTSVSVSQTAYNEKTGEFTLSVRGIGGRVYYDLGADPTEASTEIKDHVLVTTEPSLKFICIDSSEERKTGDIAVFVGEVPLKYEQRNTSDGYMMLFETNAHYEVRYTTDGSEPKENGGIYNGEFIIPENCKYVRTATMLNGSVIEQKDIEVEKAASGSKLQKIDVEKALHYRLKAKKELSDTEDTYNELGKLAQIDGLFIKGGSAFIYEKSDDQNYVEYTAAIYCTADDFKALIDLVRETSFKNRETVVTFEYKELMFMHGSEFNEWVERFKLDLDGLSKKGEIIQ